jgi:6,7-dimethyl-8-ribityllumazine synthase
MVREERKSGRGASAMPTVYTGQGGADEAGQAWPVGRFAIVVARYNESITARLLDGALKTLWAAGVADERIDVAWVPGAWEIPLVASRFARSGRHLAVLGLGAVIRGETTHDQHINRQVSMSLGQLALETGVPVLFGVLTVNSLEQALNRVGGTAGHKGVECAEAALEMARLLAKLPATFDP